MKPSQRVSETIGSETNTQTHSNNFEEDEGNKELRKADFKKQH